jgi:hypothetical protein
VEESSYRGAPGHARRSQKRPSKEQKGAKETYLGMRAAVKRDLVRSKKEQKRPTWACALQSKET